MAPCATAGIISSKERMEVACSSKFIRLSPANANRVASTFPSLIFLNLDCTFPRKLTTWREGYLCRIWLARRRDADPTTDPSGRPFKFSALRLTNTSRTSSLGNVVGNTVPSGRYVGTSFMLCTQMSTRSFNNASSNSRVKSPLPPMSAKG
eukprot:scaffold1889_cov333-Pavlova_lutheri.AAC.3